MAFGSLSRMRFFRTFSKLTGAVVYEAVTEVAFDCGLTETSPVAGR